MNALWIGNPLTKVEHLCLKSFVENGHTVHLYTYDKIGNIPDGVIIKDGNEILDKSEIYTYKNGSVSAFSNLFRFTVLYKKGGYWIDTDLLCVKPINYKEEFVFSSETNSNYNVNNITSSFIKLPKGSKEALEAINILKERKKDVLSGKIHWGEGPRTVKHIVKKFNLEKYILPWQSTCSCFYDHWPSIFDTRYNFPQAICKVEDIPPEMSCIHLWNELLRSKNVNKNDTFDPNSLFEYFKRKHSVK